MTIAPVGTSTYETYLFCANSGSRCDGFQPNFSLQNQDEVLNALDPFAAEYASLTKSYARDLQPADYFELKSVWENVWDMGKWIPDRPFPVKVHATSLMRH